MCDPGFVSNVCSPSAVLYSQGTSDSITTQVNVTHPPVNAEQTQASPGHTPLHNKANIAAKQRAVVSGMSPLESLSTLTVKDASV